MKKSEIVLGSGSPLGLYIKNNTLNQLYSFKRSGFGPEYYDLTIESSYCNIVDRIRSIEDDQLDIYFIDYTESSYSLSNENSFELRLINIIIKNIKKFQIVNFNFISSFAVYKNSNNVYLDEESSIEPITSYAKLKFFIEQYLRNLTRLHSNLYVNIYRVPCLIGKGARHNFLTRILVSICEKKSLYLSNIESDFNSVINFKSLYEFMTFISSNSKDGNGHYNLFNVVCNEPISLKQYFENHGISIYQSEGWATPPRIVSTKLVESTGFALPSVRNVLDAYFFDEE